MRDIHSHILYGVDDGAGALEESLLMLRRAREAGLTQIVATPHLRGMHFDQEKIFEHFEILKERTVGIDLQLGYEVYCDKLLQIGIEKAPQFCTQGTNELLLEFGSKYLPQNLDQILFELQGMGLKVRIAHPERYEPIRSDISIAKKIVDNGCELQVNARSFCLGPFNAMKLCTKKMMQMGLVSWIASDAHEPEHYNKYKSALSRNSILLKDPNFNDRYKCPADEFFN